MTDHIDTVKLAAEVAQGHGCSILKAFDGLSLQEQISAMNDLAKGNNMEGGTTTSRYRTLDNVINLELVKTNAGFFTPDLHLFSEKFDAVNRTIHYQCTDLTTGTGTTTTTTQALDKKF